jgi:large subunit ribosomal protein L10
MASNILNCIPEPDCIGAIETLASLPSREVLLAQVAGTIKAPLTALVSTLNQVLVKPLYVIKQIEENKKTQ